MPTQRKQQQLDTLLQNLEQSSNFALVKFDRTSHTSLESLRKELKKNNAKLRVIKNSIFEKAVNKLSAKQDNLKELQKKTNSIKENSGFLTFDQDWSAGLKAFADFSKKDTTLSFKVGVLDGGVYVTQDLIKIADLPSKAELMAKVIGGMKSPMYSLVYGMKFNMQKIVYVLSEKSKKG